MQSSPPPPPPLPLKWLITHESPPASPPVCGSPMQPLVLVQQPSLQQVVLLHIGPPLELLADGRVRHVRRHHVGAQLAAHIVEHLVSVEVPLALLVVQIQAAVVNRVAALVAEPLVHTAIVFVDLQTRKTTQLTHKANITPCQRRTLSTKYSTPQGSNRLRMGSSCATCWQSAHQKLPL